MTRLIGNSSVDSDYLKTRRLFFLLVGGWFPFGLVIGWCAPRLFHSYIPCFFLMGAYAIASLVTLFKALFYSCGECGAYMGLTGLISGKCRQGKGHPISSGQEPATSEMQCRNELQNQKETWGEYYKLKRSLFFSVMVTMPVFLGGSMLLPLAGISSRQYSPMVLCGLLILYAVIGRRYFSFPCPTCGKSYAGAQLYRRTCPHCGAAIGHSNRK